MNVVDSSAWLAYFADEPTAAEFANAIEDVDVLLVPTICLYEVFRVAHRERGENDAFQAVGAMLQGTIVDLDSELSLEAAATGLREGLALADSIIYTVAIRHGATLWTQDEHFRRKKLVEYREKQKPH